MSSKGVETSSCDTIIVGGGAAGLSTALGLARQLYNVIVFDAGSYGNDATTHMHNFISWDHHAPGEFRDVARRNILDRYRTVQYVQNQISTLTKTDNGSFVAIDSDGKRYEAKSVVLATGSKIIYPDDIAGYADCWATGIFGCLFCHGYEDRDAHSAGVLVVGPYMAVGPALLTARMARRLAKKVTLYTNGDEQAASQLRTVLGSETTFELDSRRVASLRKLEAGSQIEIEFAGGDRKVEGFLAHRPQFKLGSTLSEQLGVETDVHGNIKVTEPTYATSVAGVFAAGDCSTIMKATAQAVASGAFCAGGVSAYLSAQLYK